MRRRSIRAVSLLAILPMLLALLIAGAVGQTPAMASTTVAAFAGNGSQGDTGDGGAATSAKLYGPSGLATDSEGDVYIADEYNDAIREVNTSGTISTFYGDLGTARLVSSGGLYHPNGLAVDNSGNVYIADTLNNVVWGVGASFGGGQIVAGNSSGTGGFGGDGGSAIASGAKLDQPTGLAYDNVTGTLYIADQYNCRIRSVTSDGDIHTVAGTGTCGYSGDGGAATSAKLNYPTSVSVANGQLYIADTSNSRIRDVNLSTGDISTLAGTGSYNDTGNGGAATSAAVEAPSGLAADPAGDVFIGTASGAIREVNTQGIINGIAGISGSVQGLAIDSSDNIYASTGSYSNYVYKISGFWPPTQPSNSAVTIEAPAPSDAPYTRQISIGLSSSGIEEYQYGWSTSNTTAPDSTYLQTSTDTTDNTGTLNYLGVYSGSGTTWNGGTQPDSNYYLWIRSVNTGGSDNAWATPLLVHTPKQPIWVAVGDSYSSGWNQSADEPACPSTSDVSFFPTEPGCIIDGAPHLTKQSVSFSWTSAAVSDYNAATNAPTAWQITMGAVEGDSAAYFFPVGGAASSSFGNSSDTPGSAAWAGEGQAAEMADALYSDYDSWNVVSMTGGADDTEWAAEIKDWYSAHWNDITGAPAPWDVITSDPSDDCPDSNAVYNQLGTNEGDGHTLSWHITTNLTGMVTVAANSSPGVRVLDVGYPYIMDADSSTGISNDCTGDAAGGSWKGADSAVDAINDAVSAVSSSNAQYVSLTGTDGLGTDPEADGYIQLDRLYGFPHPTGGSGAQDRIANDAVTVLTGSGW